ncbi:MAG TPA: ABC transporter permease [Candidatus Hydrogenedentes bacterium]|nr:ABC transporter permease [Candidatus Hydrogenedentota bacterium]
MNTLSLILKEIAHRKWNALLALLAITAAVALYVGFAMLGAAAERETVILMRDLGYNLRIIPRETDETAFYERGYAVDTIPQEYVRRFAGKQGISYRHLRASLKERIRIGDADVLLVGVTTEVHPAGAKERPMAQAYDVPPGHVVAGFHAARRLGLEDGATVEIAGASFVVDRCLLESGTEEDVTLYGNLDDVQRILGKEGRINEIQALECLCVNPKVDTLDKLRAELIAIMPEAKVIKMRDIAEARQRQRFTTQSHLAVTLDAAIVGCGLWIAVLALLNVRERRCEIGILRALGYGSARIAALFLGKAALLGALGACIGFAAGTLLSLRVGPGIFQVTAQAIVPMYGLLAQAVVVAPVFAAACSVAPTALAVTQDPAHVLRDA